MHADIDRFAGHYVTRRGVDKVAQAVLGRPFLGKAPCRMVVYYEPQDISFTQIYPFIYYREALKERYGVQLRCYPNTTLLAGGTIRNDGADIVLLQTWFDVTPTALDAVFTRLKTAHPGAEISYIDSFAHSDVRLARLLEPEIKYSVKFVSPRKA